jgi:protoporphyrinogen oxidase
MSATMIIGAGPAGLTAAYELSKLGEGALILEADTQVGGLSRTVNYKGYRFDIGGHRFFSKIPYINELWREILQEDFLLQPRLSRIHYKGHFFDYPLKAGNALAGLGALEALRVCLSYARAKICPYGGDDNFESWVANRFGYRLYDIFFKTYTEKVWGVSCHEISADWATQRIKNLSLKNALRQALFGQKHENGRLITTLIEQFHYPRFGPGMMWERCERLLAQRGVPTQRGERVEKIQHRRGRVELITTRQLSDTRTEFGGKHFISTMPLRELIFALQPPPPDNVLQAARHLRYRDYLTVVLIVKRENVFSDNWIYIHTPEVKLGRVQNYKNWSAAMVPEASRTSLGLEYFLWEKDEEWRWPNERLIELGIRECEQIGLIQAREVEDGTVVRMQKAYPVYDANYRDSLEIIRHYLANFSNLQTIGRNGLHRYNNQDHSMLTGVYAARNITGETNDVWAVNTEMEYHEEAPAKDARFGDRLTPAAVAPSARLSPEEVIEIAFARLDPLALGVAVGLVSALVLFLLTGILLLKGGPVIGPNLSLLANYFIGYKVTWLGAFFGALEAGLGGFAVGNLLARLRNWGVQVYARLAQKRAAAEERRNLLEKV